MKFQPKEKLEGKRILLEKLGCSFELANQRYSVVVDNRSHLLPWLEWAAEDVTTSAESYYDFLVRAKEKWEQGTDFEFVILDKITKSFIGSIGFYKRDKDEDKKFEIGFWIRKECCNKGYVQEAVTLLEEEIFSLGAEVIIIRNDTHNIASRNVAQKLGYFLDGVLRNDSFNKCLGKFTDTNVFSKLRSDYVTEKTTCLKR